MRAHRPVLYFGSPAEEMEMEEKETTIKDFIEHLLESLLRNKHGDDGRLSLRQLRFPRRLKRGSYSSARFFVSNSQNCAPQSSTWPPEWQLLDHRLRQLRTRWLSSSTEHIYLLGETVDCLRG